MEILSHNRDYLYLLSLFTMQHWLGSNGSEHSQGRILNGLQSKDALASWFAHHLLPETLDSRNISGYEVGGTFSLCKCPSFFLGQQWQSYSSYQLLLQELCIRNNSLLIKKLTLGFYCTSLVCLCCLTSLILFFMVTVLCSYSIYIL